MLDLDFCKVKTWDGRDLGSCVYSPKLDGWRFRIGIKQAITRGYKDMWPRLCGFVWMRRLQAILQPGSCVDVEIYHTDRRDVIAAIDNKEAMVYPIGVPRWCGEDVRGIAASRGLQQLRWIATELEIDLLDDICDGKPARIQELFDSMRRKGFEGVVLKQRAYNLWWKVKESETKDMKIVELHPGKGKFRGKAGAATVVDGEFSCRVSTCGLDYKIGDIVEIGFQKFPLHPRILRKREDLM